MSKRFTDTEKWHRPWLRKLPSEYKLLWFFMLDECDIAGIWYVDFELASFLLGVELEEKSALQLFEKQIRVLETGKRWWIEGFCDFQYGALSSNSSPHKSVILKLEKVGLYPLVSLTPELPQTMGISTHMDKDKDKDKAKDKEKEQDSLFAQFWSAYPRKDDKASSRKAWVKVEATQDLLQVILAKLQKEKQSDQWSKDNGQYIPLPTTWLNKRRWENEGVLLAAVESPEDRTFRLAADKHKADQKFIAEEAARKRAALTGKSS